MLFDVILSVIALAFAAAVLINLLRHEKKMNKRAEELDKGWERLQHPVMQEAKNEGLCAICKDNILDNSPTVKVIVHLSCIKPVFPAKKEDFKVNAWHKPPND